MAADETLRTCLPGTEMSFCCDGGWSMTVNMKMDLVGQRWRAEALEFNEAAAYLSHPLPLDIQTQPASKIRLVVTQLNYVVVWIVDIQRSPVPMGAPTFS